MELGGRTVGRCVAVRERDNLAYRRLSIGYHAVALVVVSWIALAQAGLACLAITGLFGWLPVRAWILPVHGLVPKQVGLIEIGNCLLLLGSIALVWA